MYLKPDDAISDLQLRGDVRGPGARARPRSSRHRRSTPTSSRGTSTSRPTSRRTSPTSPTQVTADANTPWAQADAIARYLNTDGGFVYNDQVARSHSIDTLEEFLFDRREGYCEQFASAFAAMARSVGLPTRIAVGYSYGTPQNGVWHVKNKDAHAWPEVYFAGLGWVPLEPTPGRGANAPAAPATRPQRPQESADRGRHRRRRRRRTTAGATPPPSLGSPQANQDDISLGQDAATATRPRSSVGQFFVALAFVAVALVVLALIALVVLSCSRVRRSWRRRHADDPRARVLGAWAQALDHLADAGVEPKPSATPLEFALRHAPAHGAGDAGPALDGARAAADRGAVRARSADRRRRRPRVGAGRRDRRRARRTRSRAFTRWRRRLDPRRFG